MGSKMKTVMIIIFSIPVAFLAIIGISIAIAGDWKLIAWVLGTILFVGLIAWKAGCFQKK